VKHVPIFAACHFTFTVLARAQMGIRFDKCIRKDEFENAKDLKEMGEKFTSSGFFSRK
jgi:hypothetical protein